MYVLHKTLSLLKQAPKAWNSKIDSYFFSYFFHRIQNGRSVYVKKGENEDFLIVYLYLDELVYSGKKEEMIKDFYKKYDGRIWKNEFGIYEIFLGFRVRKSRGVIFISQEKYVEVVAKVRHVKI